MDKKSKKANLIITELFMALVNQNRLFYGTINSGFDSNEEPIVSCEIEVNDGYVYTSASSQEEMSDKLDEMVIAILDCGLHKDKGVSSLVAQTNFFHN